MKPWPTKPLLEICTPKQWPTISSAELAETGFPVYGANGPIGYYHTYNHDEPTILITCRGATCGTLNISPPKSYVTGNAMALDKPNLDIIDFRFLYYSLLGRGLEDTITGAAQPQITRANLSRVVLPIPPKVEQKRIVNLLDEADQLRKLRAQADRRTGALIPALFHEMFGDPEHTRLAVKPLVELVLPERPVTYGILKPGPNIEGGVPYVRVLDIKQNRLHAHQLHKTTRVIADQYRRSILRPGDILITIRGTVGRTCIVPQELDGANITQDTARLTVVPTVNATYVVEFLNTPWAQSWLTRHMLGQAVKGINLGDLRKLPVPVPARPLQEEFAQRVTEIRELEASQATSRVGLDALFQSMLHRAFDGKL